MKKQFQILAATVISVVIVSCSKQGVEKPEAMQNTPEEIATSSSSSSGRTVVDPLTVGLKGWFAFNKNLKDVTNQLPDGQKFPISRAGASYTTDRKGISNAALKLDGSSWIRIANVPQQINTSLSAWVKRSTLSVHEEIITPNGRGPALIQDYQKFRGNVHTSMYTPYVKSGDFNDQAWHHIVITYDGTFVKLYVDGNLEGTSNSPQPFFDDILYYRIGVTSYYPDSFWKGAVDDVRFYSRTLSASDVEKLYNL